VASKLGVSPSQHIKNNSFQYGTTKTVVLDGAITTGDTIIIAATNPAMNQILRAGDRVQLGPSTHTNNVGASETGIVSSITNATTIELTANLTYDYADEDPVSFVGTALAGSWNIEGGWGDIDTGDIAPQSITTTAGEVGFADSYRQQIKMGFPNTAPLLDQVRFSQDLGNVLFNGYIYHYGFFYKIDWGSIPNDGTCNYELKLKVRDNNVPHSLTMDQVILNRSEGNVTAWTEYTNYGPVSSPTRCWIVVFLNKPVEAAYSIYMATIDIDDVYIEHAIGTDDVASGVYTFDDEPNMPGLVWTPRDAYKTGALANNRKFRFDATGQGRGIRKWECTAEFSNVSMTMWKNLLILKSWQDRGYLLVFHPGGDYVSGTSLYIQPTGERVPGVLYGFMELTAKSRDSWDLLNLASFTFKFTEA